MRRIWKALILLLACLVLTTCGGAGDPPSQQYQSLCVAPLDANVRTGTNGIFVAIAFRADGSATDVTSAVDWSSSLPGTVSIGSVGRFNATSAGSTTISAKLGTLTASTILTVNDNSPNLANVSLSLPLPGQPFQAIAHYDDGSIKDVTNNGIWVTTEETVSLVDASGKVTYQTVQSVSFYYGLNYNTYKVTH